MNTKSPIPLYHQMADEIKKAIRSGQLKAGEKLPTEKWYTQHYSLSRVTVRKALDELVAEGYIVHIPNKRPYVSEHVAEKISEHSEKKESIYEMLTGRGYHVTSKILKTEISKPDEAVTRVLQCKEDENILMIFRLRLADGVPFALQKIWLSEQRFPSFNPWELVEGSLRKTMEQKYGCQIATTKEEIHACLPDKDMMELLQITEPCPLVHIFAKAFSEDGKLAEYSETFFLTEKFAYAIEY